MKRRNLLALFTGVTTTSVAGCIGTLDASGSGYPSLSVSADSLAVPGLTVGVSVVRGVDDRGPARIRVELENGGDAERSPIFGALPPFTAVWGENTGGEGSAVLVPTDRGRMAEVIPETPTEAGWRATGEFAVNATAVRVPLAPGETVERTYAFLAAHDSPDLPAGQYRFEAGDYAGHETWGFTVGVTY